MPLVFLIAGAQRARLQVLPGSRHSTEDNSHRQSAELPGMKTADPYDLQRFVNAQDAGGTYDRARAELRGGRKTSHWMWFVFPQIAGLGYSPASRTYAITSLGKPGPTWRIRFSAHG